MIKSMEISGLILAGGRSRRFGEDQAKHVVAGRAMIEHVVEAVAAVADFLLISVDEEDLNEAVDSLLEELAAKSRKP